jgi:hypothetical protein
MTIGPGKYDDICTVVREDTNADLAIVIVLSGKYGDGFSCQTVDPMVMERVPEMLETVAEQIRKDMK